MAVIGGLLAFLWVLAVIIIVGLIILGLVIGLIVGLFKMSYELGGYSGFLTFTLWVGIMLFDLKVINPYFGYSVAHVVAVTSLVIYKTAACNLRAAVLLLCNISMVNQQLFWRFSRYCVDKYCLI